MRKIYKRGGGAGVTIPSWAMRKLKLKIGDRLQVMLTSKSIIYSIEEDAVLIQLLDHLNEIKKVEE